MVGDYDLEIIESFVKTAGGIFVDWKRCGKKNCKCTKGKLHGPYYYYRFLKFENGKYKRKKKYLQKEMYLKLKEALDQYRNQRLGFITKSDRLGMIQCLAAGATVDLSVLDDKYPRFSQYSQ